MFSTPLITNDAIVCGIILSVLAFIFYTESLPHPFWKKFYVYCPKLLLCYFLPGILGTLGLFSAEESQLYFVASRYFLPASLVLLTIPISVKEIVRLGPKALGVFLAGTIGVVVGGPLSLLLIKYMFPNFMNQYTLVEIGRALSTIAGSWIGGGANQAAMKEIFEVNTELFAVALTTDVLVANLWLMVLLLGVSRTSMIDKKLRAERSSLEAVEARIESKRPLQNPILSPSNLLLLTAIGLGTTAIGHLFADLFVPILKNSFPELAHYSLTSHFFWMIFISTTLALLLSFTKIRNIADKGSSSLGTVFLYFLVATIGMGIDVRSILSHIEFFVIGCVWMIIHGCAVLLAARLLRAPFFFVAVGSQANIGGAASAPIVAASFSPSLAPVGVLLAILGYAIGTYAAYLCGLWMQYIAQ